MSDIFAVAKKTPMAATILEVPFPFKGTDRGYAIVQQVQVPLLDGEGSPVIGPDGEIVERPAFDPKDVQLTLHVSRIPPAQIDEAKTNAAIECDKVGVPASGAYYDKMMHAERVRLIIEHLQGWTHTPEEGEAQEFDKGLFHTLLDSVFNQFGPSDAGEVFSMAYILAEFDEIARGAHARKNGRPTSGEGLGNLAFAN